MKSITTIVTLPWYEPETFGQCMALMSDREDLFESYDAWLALALVTETQLKRDGGEVQRIILQPKEFSAWCMSDWAGKRIDGQARMSYASAVAVNQSKAN